MADHVPDELLHRAQPASTRDSDVDYQIRVAAEYFWLWYPRIPLWMLSDAQPNVHPEYAETVDRVYFPSIDKPGILVPTSIDLSPSTQRLGKYGIDEERALMLGYHAGVLRDLGYPPLGSTGLIGGLVTIDGDTYEIVSQHRSKESYFANTQVSLFVTCTANRFQPGG